MPKCISTSGESDQKIVILTGYPKHDFRRIYNKNPTIFGQIPNPRLGTFGMRKRITDFTSSQKVPDLGLKIWPKIDGFLL